MLFHILYPLAEQFSALNVFRYITFRTGGAMITALTMSFLFGPVMIELLRSRQGQGQPIRDDGPESHLLTKKGTPTMGGVLILMAVCTATLLWTDLTNPYVWAVLAVTLGFGFIGFLDDFLKVSKRNSKGLAGKLKLAMQLAISGVAMFWILSHLPPNLQTTLAVPFFKDLLLDFGWMFVAFAVFVTVGVLERGEFDRWPGRPCHRAGDDRVRCVRLHLLSDRQHDFLGLSATELCAGCRRTRGVLWRPGRRRFGLSMVQRTARKSVHGRYRIACLGWCLGRAQRGHQARVGLGDCRRAFRARDRFRDRSSGVIQAYR